MQLEELRKVIEPPIDGVPFWIHQTWVKAVDSAIAERDTLQAKVERCMSQLERLQAVLGDDDFELVTELLKEMEEKEQQNVG